MRDEVFPRWTLGLSLGLPSGGAPTAGLSLFVARRTLVRADVGVAAETTPKTGTDYSVEIGVRQYFRPAGPIRAFVQPSVFASHLAAKDITSFAGTAGFGLECFVLERVSVSGSTGLAYVYVDKPHSGQLSTGTSALFGNIYW